MEHMEAAMQDFYMQEEPELPTKDSAELRTLLYQMVVLAHNRPAEELPAIVDEFLPQCEAHTAAQVAAARVDELRNLIKNHSEQHTTKHEVVTVHDNVPAKSTLAMVPVPHINDRIDHLTTGQDKVS
jgi:hypothetical protein